MPRLNVSVGPRTQPEFQRVIGLLKSYGFEFRKLARGGYWRREADLEYAKYLRDTLKEQGIRVVIYP